jgi:hypothetical protein
MDQDDPEERIAERERQLAQQKRIAELERQLAEAKAAERGDATATEWQDPAHHGTTQGQQPFGVSPTPGPARFVTPEEPARLQSELLHKIGISDSDWQAARQEAWSRRLRPRKLRFGVIVLVLGAAIGPLYGVVAGVTPELPSSAMWMSGILCRSPYRLAYHNEGYHYGRAPGFRGEFQCVSADSSYHVNYFAISVLQTLLVILLLFGVVAVGVLLWRLLRKPR